MVAIDLITDTLTTDRILLREFTSAAAGFVVRLAIAGLILALTFWLSRRLGLLAKSTLNRLRGAKAEDRTIADLVASIVRYAVVGVGLVAVLQQLGVATTSVLAVIGAASLAVGLALQGTLANVASGVMILLQRPFRIGDRVELSGRTGHVSGLDLFYTKLDDYGGPKVYLPNGKVFGDMIVNTSQSERRRIELTFGVDYKNDLDAALNLLMETAASDPRVFTEPKPWAKVTEIAESAVNVTMRCWVRPDDWNDARFDLTKRIKEHFQDSGLTFPYPHEVHVQRQ